MSASPTVSVVVVSYNARDLLRSCLSTIVPLVREVVVVDNASSDGSAELVEAEFPAARIVGLETNIGFGGGANVGIAATEGRYILLLNADAWPLPGALERVVERAEQAPGTALFGPQLVDLRGSRDRSVIRQPGGAAFALWTLFPHLISRTYAIWRRLSHLGHVEVVSGHEFVMGAALLLRREAIAAVGGFDENFFMYGEEVDLCTRLREAGWNVEFLPSATFVHVGGGSSRTVAGPMYLEQLRSHLRLLAKHGSIAEADRGRLLLIKALRLRAGATRNARERDAAAWLASAGTEELLYVATLPAGTEELLRHPA